MVGIFGVKQRLFWLEKRVRGRERGSKNELGQKRGREGYKEVKVLGVIVRVWILVQNSLYVCSMRVDYCVNRSCFFVEEEVQRGRVKGFFLRVVGLGDGFEWRGMGRQLGYRERRGLGKGFGGGLDVVELDDMGTEQVCTRDNKYYLGYVKFGVFKRQFSIVVQIRVFEISQVIESSCFVRLIVGYQSFRF